MGDCGQLGKYPGSALVMESSWVWQRQLVCEKYTWLAYYGTYIYKNVVAVFTHRVTGRNEDSPITDNRG